MGLHAKGVVMNQMVGEQLYLSNRCAWVGQSEASIRCISVAGPRTRLIQANQQAANISDPPFRFY